MQLLDRVHEALQPIKLLRTHFSEVVVAAEEPVLVIVST